MAELLHQTHSRAGGGGTARAQPAAALHHARDTRHAGPSDPPFALSQPQSQPQAQHVAFHKAQPAPHHQQGRAGEAQAQQQRPSSAPMRTTGTPWLRHSADARLNPEIRDNGNAAGRSRSGKAAAQRSHRRPQSASAATRHSTEAEAVSPRRYGRVSLYDHSNDERAVHHFLGAKVVRDLEAPKHGLPPRAPEDFLRSGQGLGLKQRNVLRDFLEQHPVNRDPPFKRGNGGIMPPRSAKLLSFETQFNDPGSDPRRSAAMPNHAPSFPTYGSPHPSLRQSMPSSSYGGATLFRTYYDNGTIDFVSVRWRGSRQDGLVWGRRVDKGTASAAPQSYRVWCEEPSTSEVDVAAWLPIFVEGVLEVEEPYHFMAVRGSEEMMFMAGERLSSMGLASSLVLPLKRLLDTREPPVVAVALQLMAHALSMDPGGCAREWIQHLWQFAQVFNLFLGHRMAVDMGYNTRLVTQLRALVTDILHALEEHGGQGATALVRRHCRGHDPAVTARSQARAAAKAAEKAAEAAASAGLEVEAVAAFKPFTLF